MNYAEEVIAARTDWEMLLDQVAAHGVGRALIGCSRGAGTRRYLVARVLPEHTANSDVWACCRAERLGLLELYAATAAAQAPALFADMTGARVAIPHLRGLAGQPVGIWRWDARSRQPVSVAGPRLLGGDAGDLRPAIERAGAGEPAAPAPHERLARQIDALGPAGQGRLSALTVALVGCGRTGGFVAQLLALVGVGRLLLIDDDRVEQSNCNGLVYATEAGARAGTRKVTLLQQYLRRLAPDVETLAIAGALYDRRSARSILAADLLLGCTDNEGSRLHMNALAVQHLLPYVDCGAGIERQAAGLLAGGQVRVVLPGGPCLECYDGIDRWRAAADLEPHEARALRSRHGYGLADRSPAPALAPLNAAIATEAAASVVALVTGLRPIWPYVAYDLAGARQEPRADARCSPACPACAPGRRYGRGDSLPLPQPECDGRRTTDGGRRTTESFVFRRLP